MVNCTCMLVVVEIFFEFAGATILDPELYVGCCLFVLGITEFLSRCWLFFLSLSGC